MSQLILSKSIISKTICLEKNPAIKGTPVKHKQQITNQEKTTGEYTQTFPIRR